MSEQYQTAITPKRRFTSRIGDDPWKSINRRNREGRRIRAIVERLLFGVPNRDNPMVVEHAIGIAQLMVRAAELRANPLANAAEAAVLVRIEHLIDQRTRRLGFVHKGASGPPVPSLSQLIDRARQAEKAAGV